VLLYDMPALGSDTLITAFPTLGDGQREGDTERSLLLHDRRAASQMITEIEVLFRDCHQSGESKTTVPTAGRRY
jgi:hypothetical protein